MSAPRMTTTRALALSAALGVVLGAAGCDRMGTMFSSSNGTASGSENSSGSSASSGAPEGGDQRAALDASTSGSGPSTRPGPTPVEPQPSPDEDPVPDRSARAVSFPVVPEAVTEGVFPGGAREKFADAQVPVLAPLGLSDEQAQRFVDTFRATPDGYFARLSLRDFDVVVNGTKIYATAPESAGAQQRDISELHVTESETGMSATFNRHGADYSVEFMCRGAGDEEGADCLTEAQATEFVERLIAVGGGGR